MFIILFYIFCYDLWFYASHVLLHRYPYIHFLHHTIDYRIMKYSDTYVGHFIEGPFQGLGVLFPLLFISFNLYQFLFALGLINLRGMLRHDVNSIWLVGNHHFLHHMYPKYNFGEYWIDSLMGTKYPNEEEYVYGKLYV